MSDPKGSLEIVSWAIHSRFIRKAVSARQPYLRGVSFARLSQRDSPTYAGFHSQGRLSETALPARRFIRKAVSARHPYLGGVGKAARWQFAQG
jgi:hypothetical protein